MPGSPCRERKHCCPQLPAPSHHCTRSQGMSFATVWRRAVLAVLSPIPSATTKLVPPNCVAPLALKLRPAGSQTQLRGRAPRRSGRGGHGGRRGPTTARCRLPRPTPSAARAARPAQPACTAATIHPGHAMHILHTSDTGRDRPWAAAWGVAPPRPRWRRAMPPPSVATCACAIVELCVGVRTTPTLLTHSVATTHDAANQLPRTRITCDLPVARHRRSENHLVPARPRLLGRPLSSPAV